MTAQKELRFSLNFDTLKLRRDAQEAADRDHRGNLTAYLNHVILKDGERRAKKKSK